ncbi:SH3 domain-containing protein [Roseivivax sp. CAU 1753]
MTRFILLTFGVLGFTYYEMSGGADFEPGSYTKNASELQASVAPERQPAARSTARPDFQPAPEMVSRAATGAAELTRVSAPASSRAVPVTNAVFTSASTPSATPAVQIFEDRRIKGVLLTRRDPVDVSVTTTSVASDPDTKTDLRKVAGSRVNLRQGPGTRHSVVTQLGRGDAVEVLRKEGDWLKLRVRDSNRVGWMAEYLVTAAAE